MSQHWENFCATTTANIKTSASPLFLNRKQHFVNLFRPYVDQVGIPYICISPVYSKHTPISSCHSQKGCHVDFFPHIEWNRAVKRGWGVIVSVFLSVCSVTVVVIIDVVMIIKWRPYYENQKLALSFSIIQK